ncbi:NF038122 family metalloprotease [Chamaesiphon sp. VAR_48_metabat_403]|uniref:NF038122 family metalloprotease n=1 Tax=Chamaesiphon sp. VAR_48_metabat_403 TaxID=2964700 RepID=UPI00286E271E|nr:NF038122 family metalloprotease [Chamaesiphon sp. VAR_48_metabat_403]
MKTYVVKFKQAAAITGIALSGVASSGAMTPASALTFTFRPVAGTSQAAIDGFQAAGDRWSSLFTDNVNVIIDIDFTSLAPGVLAQAGSSRRMFNYSDIANALRADRTSADDRLAVTNLPNQTVNSGVTSFNTLINRTTNNPNGVGSATPYLDTSGANTSMVNISSANAKALGLSGGLPAARTTNIATILGSVPAPEMNRDMTIRTSPTNALTVGSDAEITFSTGFAFDFNPDDGIDFNKFDFIGVATHEIGHALGFTSGVDVLDGNSPPINGPFFDDQFTFVNSLDLFRYSADSVAAGAIDWTADTRAKYLSFDRGATSIGGLATGQEFGDGQQASHWKDSTSSSIAELGIMNPTFSNGQLGIVTENDLRAFDVIGWNRVNATATEVPEPSNVIGTLMFAGFGAKMVLKRRKKLAELNVKSV